MSWHECGLHVLLDLHVGAPPHPPLTRSLSVRSEYGFAEKVVEGMSVRINSITIKVQARAFHASFELWQLQGSSLNPKWQRSDLRYTRITDPKRGEVHLFPHFFPIFISGISEDTSPRVLTFYPFFVFFNFFTSADHD